MAASGVPWFCYARVERIDRAMAKELASAGCKRVFLGVETMRQANLDYFNKQTTVAQNRAAVEHLAAAGIGVVAGFIIGSPDDTVASILYDLDEFLSLPLFAINCSILSPDPGTAEFRRARRREELRPALGGDRGTRLVPDPERYGLAAPMGLPTVCKAMSKTFLNVLQTLIDTRFYARIHIWDGLVRDRSSVQQSVVADYYRYLARSIAAVQNDVVPQNAREHLDTARTAIANGPWAMAVV